MARKGLLSGENVTMTALANTLSNVLNRTVIDQTALGGSYAIRLEWNSSDSAPPATLDPDLLSPPSAQTDASNPSLSTALQEQLGLRLGWGKAVIKTLVIDSVEKASEN